MDDHQKLVTAHHRFAPRQVGRALWSFEHLEAFALKAQVELAPGQICELDVVVLFSDHCFTRSALKGEKVDPEMLWNSSMDTRVLDQTRYDLSSTLLRTIINGLGNRRIHVADASRPNFVTLELIGSTLPGGAGTYAVFFELKRDRNRAKRLLLRVQTAYLINTPNNRMKSAQRIGFSTLLKRAYLGQKL
jgi:hypothetical protein